MVLVNIDSRQGIGTQIANFEYTLSRPVNKVSEMNLLHARIPNQYTVITGYNDKVYYYAASDGSGNTLLEATLTAGYYTEDELTAELNTQMTANATSCVYSSTYDTNSNKITLIGSEDTRFATQALVASGSSTANGIIYLRVTYLLGLDSVTLKTAGTSLVSPYQVNLVSVRYYTIVIELNGYKHNDSINDTSTFSFIVPTNTDSLQGAIIYKEEDFRQTNRVNNVNVTKIGCKTYLENDLSQTFTWSGLDITYIIELVQAPPY